MIWSEWRHGHLAMHRDIEVADGQDTSKLIVSIRNNAGMTHTFETAVRVSAERLRQLCGTRTPTLALLLGTGWRATLNRFEVVARWPYAELPGFPRLSVEGHPGDVLLCRLAGRQVWALTGREHAYERGRVDAMRGLVHTLSHLGVQALIQTNAAGSLTSDMAPGSVMLIEDHLNMVQASPLTGLRGDDRFVHMGDAYDARLRAQAKRAAAAAGLVLHEGVYAWMRGPQFETPAEIRMLQRLGAHAVGMSTVPETVLARHVGIRVMGLSLLTNMGCGLSEETLSHAHTLAQAGLAGSDAARLIEAIVGALEI